MCKVLLIDDDKMDTEILTKKLLKLNSTYEFIVVNEVNKINEYLQRLNFDIVLIDYKLDINTTALDIIDRFRQYDDRTPVVVITGAIGEEKAAEIMRNGAADLFLKNTNIEKLDRIIQREVYYYKNHLSLNDRITLSNNVLFKLAKTVNWIMQNDCNDVSFQKIISTFGKLMEVDRAYIFKKVETDNNCQYVLEYIWNDEDISSIQNSYDCDLYIINNYIEQMACIFGHIHEFDEETHAILKSNDIKSFVYLPIINMDQTVWGFIGFDVCKVERIWTYLEINTLSTIAAIIGTVLYRMGLKEQEEQMMTQQIQMLKNASESIMKLIDNN